MEDYADFEKWRGYEEYEGPSVILYMTGGRHFAATSFSMSQQMLAVVGHSVGFGVWSLRISFRQ